MYIQLHVIVTVCALYKEGLVPKLKRLAVESVAILQISGCEFHKSFSAALGTRTKTDGTGTIWNVVLLPSSPSDLSSPPGSQ